MKIYLHHVTSIEPAETPGLLMIEFEPINNPKNDGELLTFAPIYVSDQSSIYIEDDTTVRIEM